MELNLFSQASDMIPDTGQLAGGAMTPGTFPTTGRPSLAHGGAVTPAQHPQSYSEPDHDEGCGSVGLLIILTALVASILFAVIYGGRFY